MISRVQNSAKEATTAMGHGCEEAQQGGEQARDIADFLDTITGSVAAINEMVAQIAHATEEQTVASNGIHQGALDLNNQSERSVVAAGESNDISQRLNGLTGQLKKLVRQFD